VRGSITPHTVLGGLRPVIPDCSLDLAAQSLDECKNHGSWYISLYWVSSPSKRHQGLDKFRKKRSKVEETGKGRFNRDEIPSVDVTVHNRYHESQQPCLPPSKELKRSNLYISSINVQSVSSRVSLMRSSAAQPSACPPSPS